MTHDHNFCFRLECPKPSGGAALILPYWFVDSLGQRAKADLTVPFCSVDCLFRFVGPEGLVGVIEGVLSTHRHFKLSSGAQPTKAPDIRLKETDGDPVITMFVVPTSWTHGRSHMIVGYPFSTLKAANSFWDQCDHNHYNLLLYIFERMRKDEAEGQVPATIKFVIPGNAGDGPATVAMQFSSLDAARKRWEEHGRDFSRLLLALLQPK